MSESVADLWWSRPDLQDAFPGVFLDPAAREAFRTWLHTFGRAEGLDPASIPEISHPVDASASSLAESLTPGVTALAYHRAVLGVGSAGRRLSALLEAAGERVYRRSYDHTDAPLNVFFGYDDDAGVTAPALDILVLAVNGSETERASRALGPAATKNRYRIGFWAWELEHVPPEQIAGFDYVDEVWCNSTFVRDALRRVAPRHIPVHAVPFGIGISKSWPAGSSRAPDPQRRHALGLPMYGPLIGFAFDYASSLDRKNPLALVDAYCAAVPAPTPSKLSPSFDAFPGLVIKTLNAGLHPEDAAKLRAHIASKHRADIRLIDRVYSNDDHHDFMRALSGYASLHRSEGFGLGLLEAMTLGIPVIATGYSGNLDFMNANNSWLIPYRLVPTRSSGPYGNTNTAALWAEPDTPAAARAIETVLANTSEVQARAKQASKDAHRHNDSVAGARWIKHRLAEIRAERSTDL